mgnify:CR=1 FL=1
MYDARNASSTVRHATPSAPRVLRPIPQHPARRNMHTSSPRAHGACIFSFCLQSANSALPCLIIKNIVDNAGLPTAYGIDQNIKIAFVLLLVPTVACWYAFLGSGLRGEQSYSPARPMVFRRGTPSIFKELLSGFSFAIAQPALLWFVIRPMLAVNGASALMLEDGMPLLAYGIGTVCCVVIFAVSCCVAPCTFGTFQRMPRGGYAIDPMNGAIETSHESSGFSIAGILEIAQTLFDDCLR